MGSDFAVRFRVNYTLHDGVERWTAWKSVYGRLSRKNFENWARVSEVEEVSLIDLSTEEIKFSFRK